MFLPTTSSLAGYRVVAQVAADTGHGSAGAANPPDTSRLTSTAAKSSDTRPERRRINRGAKILQVSARALTWVVIIDLVQPHQTNLSNDP